MLILTRMSGEKIWIGPDICITVVEIRRNRVRLGLDAPEELGIHRDKPMDEPDGRDANGTTKQPDKPIVEGR